MRLNGSKFILFILTILCTLKLNAQDNYCINLNIRVENFTDSATVCLGPARGSGNFLSVVIGELSRKGRFNLENYRLYAPQFDEPVPVMFRLLGPHWDETESCIFYALPGDHVRIKGNDKHLNSFRAYSANKVQKTVNAYLGMIAKADEWMHYCKNRVIALNDIVCETEAEYKVVEDSLHVWHEKWQNATARCCQEKMKALKQTPFNVFWKREMLSIVEELISYNFQYLYSAAQKVLETAPAAEKKQPWYNNVYSLLHPKKPIKTGEAVEAALEDMNGNSYNLSQFRDKSVLLAFWEECGSCKAAIPELEWITKEYEDKVQVIYVTNDYDNQSWKSASNRMNISSKLNLRDKAGTGGLWKRNNVKSIPTFVLLSPQGTIKYKRVGYSDGLLIHILKENGVVKN